MLKFFDQVLEGEIKESLPRWAGIDGINEIIDDINGQIQDLSSGTLTSLNQEISLIESQKDNFKEAMEESGNQFFDTPTGNTYHSNFKKIALVI